MANNSSTFPIRTAGAHQLKCGSTVWIVTMNSLQRNYARENADLAAARYMQRYHPGTDGSAYLAHQLSSLETAELLQMAFDAAKSDAATRSVLLWPDIPHPVRDTLETDEEFCCRVTAWDQACLELPSVREDYANSQAEEVRKRALNLQREGLIELCKQYWCRQRYQQEFGCQFTLYTLCTAVRDNSDRWRPFWSSVEQVADLDDDDREALVARYLELDRVTDAMVPTLPLRCSGQAV